MTIYRWAKAFGVDNVGGEIVHEAALLHEYLTHVVRQWEEVATSFNKRKSTFFDMLGSSDRSFKGLDLIY